MLRLSTGMGGLSTCVLCGPAPATLVVATNGFKIVRCGWCGLFFVDGARDLQNLDDFYGATYYQGEGNAVCGYRDYVADRAVHLKNSKAILSVIERVATGPGRVLLDVGCAHGFFLLAARARGWAPHGVDISAEAVEYARRDLGLSVVRGNIDDCGLDPLSVDVVTLIGTIEHLTDPMRTLRSAARLLRSGGLLVVTTPDIEGRLGYVSWKPPEHLFYFSARTLSRLIAEAGFTVERCRIDWKHYRIADLCQRLWGYWGLPNPNRCAQALERLGLGKFSVKIPTNEMLVIARRR